VPTINIYFQNDNYASDLEALTNELKIFVADKLTCGDRKLNSNEISVRLLQSGGKGMLAKVELEITAAPYKERVEKQDQICLDVRQFILEHVENLDDAQVWLSLNELGHSQE